MKIYLLTSYFFYITLVVMKAKRGLFAKLLREYWPALLLGLVVFLFFLLPGVRAENTDTVTATVTVQNISVSVTDGTVDYQTLGVGTSATTATGDGDSVDDTQTATNDGNVTEDFDIKGQDSSGGWTLATSPGDEQYTHEFCTSDCDSSPTWTPLTTSYDTLATGITTSGTQNFDLRIQVPTSTTDYDPQSVDVTVLATATGS